MNLFHEGESAILRDGVGVYEKYNGEECTVVLGFGPHTAYRSATDSFSWIGYGVLTKDGHHFGVQAHQLRKKFVAHNDDVAVPWDAELKSLLKGVLS